MVVQSPRPGLFWRRFVAVSVGVQLLIPLPVGSTAAFAADGEDETNPVVMKRNIISLSDRAISLGTEMGFPQETLDRLAELRQQLDSVSDQEFEEVSVRLGPEAAQARRALERIVVRDAGTAGDAAPGNPQFGDGRDASYQGQSPALASVSGHWSYDPSDVRIARTPNFDFNVKEKPSGEGSTSAKICSNNSTLACKIDADCGQGNSCIDRPTSSKGSGDLSISKNCAGAPPDDQTLRDLLIVSTVLEGVAMVMDRVCGQELFGFNISLVCIVSDLIFLAARSIYDFESLCADRWAGAEAHAVYDRTGALHDDLMDTQGSIASFQSDTANQFSSLNSSMDSQFSAVGNQLTNMNNQITGEFTAVVNQLTNVDNHLTTVDNHIAAEFTALDTHLVNLVSQLSTQVANGTALLNADLRQVMKLLLTPDGRRQIVPAILTCNGSNCPNVLANCAAAGCSWNNVGPLP